MVSVSIPYGQVAVEGLAEAIKKGTGLIGAMKTQQETKKAIEVATGTTIKPSTKVEVIPVKYTAPSGVSGVTPLPIPSISLSPKTATPTSQTTTGGGGAFDLKDFLQYVGSLGLQTGVIEPTLPLAMAGYPPAGFAPEGEFSVGTFAPERLASDKELPQGGGFKEAIDVYTKGITTQPFGVQLPDVFGFIGEAGKWALIGLIAIGGLYLAGKFIGRKAK